jgi:diguanylate cyclase (GGDEF)-like protein/PAS domain S-box-containing protein
METSRELHELRERLRVAERELVALTASEQRARAVLDTAVDGILTIDGNGRVESMNRAAEEMFGYSACEVVGRNVRMLMPEPSRSEHDGYLERYQHTGERRIVGRGREVAGRRRDGSTFPIELAVSQVDSERQLFTGIIRDITERKQLEAQLTRHALHDPLTGLGNRALLMERLDHALARRPRRGGLLALYFLDLDRFKLVNDTLGHEAGDDLLIEVAARLTSAVRREDLVVRLGGDEFVLLCDDLVDVAGAEIVAARVVDMLAAPLQLRGREIFVSASVGVVTDTGQRSAAELLRDADVAMYRAKQQGRARYSLVGAVATAVTSDRLQLSSDLHHVHDRAQLRALYQPLVDLRTGEVRGAEALLRWQHAERGLLAPASFLDIADDIGLTASFDSWMLRAACDDAMQWGRELGRPVAVSVNLSARSLADRRLPERVAAALEQSRLEPGLLTLEITEGALMQNAAATVRMLTALRELGVQLAVDDFGTGYSSLAYLQQFPVQALKVDRSFVARLDEETQDSAGSAAIVRAVVSLAAGLGLRTVAEGIETPGQLAAVIELGCDLGQGYFLGRPAPAANIPFVVPDGVVLPGAYAQI